MINGHEVDRGLGEVVVDSLAVLRVGLASEESSIGEFGEPSGEDVAGDSLERAVEQLAERGSGCRT